MTTAISDMETAFRDAAGRLNPNFVELSDGDIENMTLSPGLYKWGGNVEFTSHLYFDGSSTDVWILQIAENLSVGSGAIITLENGATADNIFWQISGSTLFGSTSDVKGIFLSATSIVFETGSKLTGAALAQTAVTLDAATIVKK